jgi:hypothetical protein
MDAASVWADLRALEFEGSALPRGLRAQLERSFGADLREVRIHDGPRADRLASEFCADAFACGGHVVFRNGAYDPESESGRRLVAHEVAHVVRGERPGSAAARGASLPRLIVDAEEEREADRAAALALRGCAAERSAPAPHRGLGETIRRHVSFEHRMLGDNGTSDLVQISTGGPQRNVILANQIALLQKWQYDPGSVSEHDIQVLCPWIRTVRLGPGNLLVTYGELNALPDYFANPIALDTLPAAVVLPILQCIRQEGYNQLTLLLSGSNPNVTFNGAAAAPWKLSMVNAIVETSALDTLTFGLGINGADHYQGLLARNACHFAPYSWYRWQSNHIIARDLALRAHVASSSGDRARLTREAWVFHGYADHFLQDSFAAGHLVNKTLVMQWFVEWAAGQTFLPVADWDLIKNMTVALQPGLAGPTLYDPNRIPLSADPQTADEQLTIGARMRATGVAAEGLTPQATAYQNFLTLLTSAAAQLASANLHDYYNANSAWVSSIAQPAPYEIWGDDTLFTGNNGGAGVAATSGAAQLSQHALEEILATGSSTISTETIRQYFPNRAGSSSTSLTDLQSWNNQQKASCFTSFQTFGPTLKSLLLRFASPRLGTASRDHNFSNVWFTSLPGAGYQPVQTVVYR